MIFEEPHPCREGNVEENCAELGRRILLLVLSRFREDLVEEEKADNP